MKTIIKLAAVACAFSAFSAYAAQKLKIDLYVPRPGEPVIKEADERPFSPFEMLRRNTPSPFNPNDSTAVGVFRERIIKTRVKLSSPIRTDVAPPFPDFPATLIESVAQSVRAAAQAQASNASQTINASPSNASPVFDCSLARFQQAIANVVAEQNAKQISDAQISMPQPADEYDDFTFQELSDSDLDPVFNKKGMLCFVPIGKEKSEFGKKKSKRLSKKPYDQDSGE